MQEEFKNTIFILYRESCGSEGLRQTVLNPPSPPSSPADRWGRALGSDFRDGSRPRADGRAAAGNAEGREGSRKQMPAEDRGRWERG